MISLLVCIIGEFLSGIWSVVLRVVVVMRVEVVG